jgi:hypothetical protein
LQSRNHAKAPAGSLVQPHGGEKIAGAYYCTYSRRAISAAFDDPAPARWRSVPEGGMRSPTKLTGLKCMQGSTKLVAEVYTTPATKRNQTSKSFLVLFFKKNFFLS